MPSFCLKSYRLSYLIMCIVQMCDTDMAKSEFKEGTATYIRRKLEVMLLQ